LSVDSSAAQGGDHAALGPMPPHAQFFDFLTDSERLGLFKWAVSQQNSFKPADIFYGQGGRESKYDPAVRHALKFRSVGPFEQLLRAKLLNALSRIMSASGYRGKEPRSIDFELNAYGEGAHFAPHIDNAIGVGRKPLGKETGEDRVITAVYYFHREPKAFQGGELRLYRFGNGTSIDGVSGDDSKAFEPTQNSLLVFPSWAKHRVEPVSCPTGRFADYRFALNCWFCCLVD
jgi:SM-20-related protein